MSLQSKSPPFHALRAQVADSAGATVCDCDGIVTAREVADALNDTADRARLVARATEAERRLNSFLAMEESGQSFEAWDTLVRRRVAQEASLQRYVAENAKLRTALQACFEWFDNRSDGEDWPPIVNEEMHMAAMCRDALREVRHA